MYQMQSNMERLAYLRELDQLQFGDPWRKPEGLVGARLDGLREGRDAAAKARGDRRRLLAAAERLKL